MVEATLAHRRMFDAANTLGIRTLRLLAEKLLVKASEVCETACDSLTFWKLIYAIPVSRSSAARRARVEKHAGSLKNFNTHPDFPALLKELPEFAADLVGALTEKLTAAEEALKERAHATAAVEPQTEEWLSAKEDHSVLEEEVLGNVDGTNDDRDEDGEPGEQDWELGEEYS